MSINNKEIPILVIYSTKSRIIYQTEFDSSCKFCDLIDFFNTKIASDSIKLKDKYLLNDKEIKENDSLIDLIQVYTLSKKIISATFSIELDEVFNIGDEEILPFKKILQPKLDNFGLYVFTPESGSLALEEYPEKIVKFFKLKKIDKSSAYCNSYDSLFISGGIYNEKELKDFWIIDNKNYKIEKKEMPNSKSFHSMIYIEYKNKKFIFFLGGNNNTSFYYDINNKKFESWGDMNSLYINPSSILIENYLYCFNFSSNENNQIFFEKTNLDGNEHIWEKVYPNFESDLNIEKFIHKKFCVSKVAGKKIIFIGNKEEDLDQENIYLYDIDSNLIYLNQICFDKSINSIDKNFYKINSSHNIILPDLSNENGLFEIGILNKIKYTFRKVRLNPCEKNQIIFKNYKNIRDENSNIGKILVEFKTAESLKNFDVNDDNKNENNLEQFIFNVDSNKINSEKNIPTMLNSNFQNNEKEENELENNDNKHKENIEQEEENYEEEDINMFRKNKEDKEDNEINSNDKNEDYIIYDKSDVDNDNVDNVDKKFNEENEIEDSLQAKINSEENNENYNEENKENEELGEDLENAEDEEIERDKFELTIKQPLGEDIIQIENYPMSRYDPDNFCDYEPK